MANGARTALSESSQAGLKCAARTRLSALPHELALHHVPVRNRALAGYGFEAYIPSPMIADEIKELAHAEPFRPIRIVLTDRQAFTVVIRLIT